MGKTKLKIAYFHQDGLVTGSAISLRHFLSAMNRDVFEPIVILAKEGSARNLYESLNIQVLVYEYRTFWTFPGPRFFSRGMIRQLGALVPDSKLRKFIIEEVNPDIIHINDKASLNVGITLIKSGIPIVQHCRSSYFITASKLGKYLSAKIIKRFSNHIICISEDEEDGFDNFPNKSTIYNTVDFTLIKSAKEKRYQIRQEFGLNNDDILIGFAAHVSEKKGAWDFLEICNQFKKKLELKFVLAGQLDEHGNTYIGKGQTLHISPKVYVENYIKEKKLENQLIVTGFRKNILELIAAMDILVVPNKNGVLGRQPIEAQALGVTVIAQNGHSKKCKVIEDGVTGYLVESIEQCIDQIKQIVRSNVFDKMTKSAENYAKKNFNPVINMRRIENIYLNLINQ